MFKLSRYLTSALLLFSAFFVQAAGVAPSTVVPNQAFIDYTITAVNYSDPTNIAVTTVDELINLTLIWQDPPNVAVNSPSTNRVLTFLLTNTGNGTESYTLNVNNVLGGDNFDPTFASIYFDTNGSGVFDVGDILYVSGTNDPILIADANVTLFVLNDIPAALVNGDIGNSQLTAASNTGSGAAGTTFNGAGDGGTDALIGITGGTQSAIGTYVVNDANVAIVKSYVINDAFGGNSPFTGATITYTLTVTTTGAGTADNVVITDAIPANTTYTPNSLTLNGGNLSDTSDTDEGDFNITNANTITVDLGSLTAASGVQIITFDTTINQRDIN